MRGTGPIKQVVRTASGSLLAMAAGGGPYTPPGQTVLYPAPVLHKSAGAGAWTDVTQGFPAGGNPPAGVAVKDWDDDGDREGRFLCPVRHLHRPLIAQLASQPSKSGLLVDIVQQLLTLCRWIVSNRQLADGRVLVLWAYAHNSKGIHCKVSSHDGLSWSDGATVVLLPNSAQTRHG